MVGWFLSYKKDKNMIRIQIKDKTAFLNVLLECLCLGYSATVNNKNGNCIFIIPYKKTIIINHYTDDNPILVLDNDFHYRWLINSLK